ncbi:uncharacterized protein N7496_012287 [Penicillium cataractarum]|uniref:Uncharacterized protein n=1 Tax=Penicillium cataractarum TaxID=2100454 RepID=A0A9W9UTP6_9EURO|nr:uncharacterized protein N7496_012287 [Penicillium cataractarum]KAJ5355075.1 hypothetical protein N7496_012287 [Penicillium cataractarum]
MGSSKLVTRLITEKTNIHATQSWQEPLSGVFHNVTALHIASAPQTRSQLHPTTLLTSLYQRNSFHTDINKPDINGWMALHFIARNLRQVGASRLLVRRGVDVHAISRMGNTAVHEVMGAAKLQRREMEDGTLECPAASEKIWAGEEVVSVLRGADARIDGPKLADAGGVVSWETGDRGQGGWIG